MFRQHAVACSLALLSIGVVGCSSQPVAPSSLPSGTAPTASIPALTATLSATLATELAAVRGGGGPHDRPVVYVTGQGLYYDSIVTATLPMHGRFQQLVPGGESGLMTEFGPGDQGYVGGRWWLDNAEMGTVGVQDEYDTYFLCPLLGPGRSTP